MIYELPNRKPIKPEEVAYLRRNLKIGEVVEILVDQVDKRKKELFEKRKKK